jgi:hypothetical protein
VKFIHAIHQTARANRGASRLTSSFNMFICSTILHSRRSKFGFIIKTEEEEDKLTRLEKMLLANIDINDQALQVLGFQEDIYQLLGNLG